MNRIERHYNDEALISLIETNRAATDTHLPSCEPCSAKIESFRMIADALCDQEVWDREVPAPVPTTIANLRAFADRMTDEDSRAELILQELLAGSREEWMPRLREHPEWRTAGVVRKLIAATDRALDTMPLDAVSITSLATEIADRLEPGAHPSDTVARLRGAAWRERAYSLFYTGQYPAAESAIFASERHLSSCVIAEYDLARLGIVRALVLRGFEKVVEASAIASSSTRTFVDFADTPRLNSARLTEVHLFFSRGNWSGAETILQQLEMQVRTSDDAKMHARVLANLAYCYRRLGRAELAIRYYDMATTLLEDLGIATEATRTRWNAAAMVVEAGRFSEGSQRLQHVRDEFDRLGMVSASALAALDIADVLLAEGRFEEVEKICMGAMTSFESAGLAYTARALTAIAFIREAAIHRKADRALVRDVRDYLERLPTEPHLLFAFPPA